MDSRKNIAVYLPQIYTEFVVRLRNGIEEEASKRGFHLIFFTSLVDNASFGSTGHENENYNEGERAIFYLADFDKVDALIVLYDAFANTHWQDLFDIIYERCHCPVINIRTPLDGVYNILMDDDISFANMIQHFIDVHKVHRLNLVTGPEENVHARMRLDIYKKVLEKNQIPYEKERVYYGNFWRNCGEGAIQAFLDCGKEMPEAIICANDYMAMSVIQALEEIGYTVPEDVMVSGYDNIEEGLFYTPSLTTVQQPVESMGRKAVEMAEQILAGQEVEKEVYLPSEILCRCSCGCEKKVERLQRQSYSYSSVLAERMNEMAFMENTATAMITFMSNAADFEDCIKCIQEYALLETGFEEFALCLADNWEQQIMIPKSDEIRACQYMKMVVGIKGGKILEEETFPMSQLLPQEFLKNWSKPYYVFPLHYLQYYLGYALVTIRHNVPHSANIRAWFSHIDNALENIRIRRKMESMVRELQNLYDKDTLTGLYNRRGLDSMGLDFYRQCMVQGTQLLVMEIDMDGLKKINDQFGHMEGDIGIISIAKAMQNAAVNGEICIRSGGDEFILIGKDYSQERLRALIADFRRYIQQINARSQKPYEFGASIGYYMAVPDGEETLEFFLKKADDAMYEEKKRHKAMRE